MKTKLFFCLWFILNLNARIRASAGELPFDIRNGTSDESIFHMFDRQIGWARGTNGILRTTNGGASWRIVLPTAPRQPVGCFFYDAKTAWAAVGVMDDATNATIFRTTDAGKTWQRTEVSDRSPIIECLFSFPSKTNGWMMIIPEHTMNSEPGTLYHSVDSGQTWQTVNSGQWFNDEDTLKPESAWAQPHLPFCGSILFRNDSTGWLVGSYTTTTPGYLFASPDGGKNWRGQVLPFPKSLGSGRIEPMGLPHFFPRDGKIGILEGDFVPTDPESTNRVAIVYRTRDRGETWQAGPAIPALNSRCSFSFYSASGGYLWIDQSLWNTSPAKGTLLRTRDGGGSWTEVKPQKSLADVLALGLRVVQLEFVDEQCGWAVAISNTLQAQLVHTIDGGRTWTELSTKIDP